MGSAKFADVWPGSMAFYSKQKNPLFDQLLLQGRLRFLYAGAVRQAGWPAPGGPQDSRRCAAGVPADMDFGRTDSVFVPFSAAPIAPPSPRCRGWRS